MKHITLIAALLGLSACSSIFPQKEAQRLFVLNVPRVSQPQTTPLPLSLQIMLPQANQGLDSERIALRTQGQEMNYFEDARWSGALPRIVQEQIVEAFENHRSVASVGSDLVQFRADYALAVDIRDFQAEYGSAAAPTAHVRLSARLIDTTTYNVVTTLIYEEYEPASANRLLDVIAAGNTAFTRASTNMVQQVGALLAQRHPSPPEAPQQ